MENAEKPEVSRRNNKISDIMLQIANLIQTKLPDYKDFAFYAYNMPYNHQWEEKKYNNWAIDATFNNLKTQYSNVPLTRQMIINLFKKGYYYDGFLCAMIWGNIGINISGKNSFNKVFNVSNRINIEHNLHNVIGILQKNDIKTAYQSLQGNGIYRINGISESFYTKLLYFASVSISNLYPPPLIFDSIMHNVYAKILTLIGSNKPKGAFNIYSDYCAKMEELRSLLSLPTSGHVEALLFCPGIRAIIF